MERVVVEDVRPLVDCARFPAKAALDQPVEVTASVFADGPGLVTAWVRHGTPGAPTDGHGEVAMRHLGQDKWAGRFTPPATGPWQFEVVGLYDHYGTWVRDLRMRIDAGQDVVVEIEDGARIVEQHLSATRTSAAARKSLQRLLTTLRGKSSAEVKLEAAELPSTRELLRETADRSRATVIGPFPLFVDRPLATFSAWYEMFPRSEGATATRSGTLCTAARRLGDIAAMGFDVVYLPPIHPIGASHRKGANNSLDCGPADPGSPWAIGSPAGGHTAVHPDLGTVADFDAFVAEARRLGLEVALDYALQCSPDHPWVSEHPEWFRHRADGSIRYAENPPKRYQDIYPLNFDTQDIEALYAACRDILLFWIGHGVRVFRVDNPHTKPLPFWERLIGELRAAHPEIIVLAEAFTRPAVMRYLAKAGFTQSYTYFTWRNWKAEVSEYLYELSQTPMVDYFRPNFWVNTPDILHEMLQKGGPPAFRMRAALAAIACPSWGMYSGYELYERTPLREGSEEYLDSEKYQYRPRDWSQPDSLAPFITELNGIRRRHREAISLLRTLRLHHIDSDALICVSRASDDGGDVLLMVLNLDPTAAHEATTWLDMDALGIADDRPFTVHDELTGADYTWQGPLNYVRLDPEVQPAHVFSVRQP
ncbi:MAG TPA: alpha-1,4-glucan--maltose-1-phosphate maltosyltransferase [Candidatus Dormibacteraeota bacterium]|nr:alpha-1,4-glucan--maltose-1-phosphate maltosyltransferase [Candidatus Dormibacteraeota bacterium]